MKKRSKKAKRRKPATPASKWATVLVWSDTKISTKIVPSRVGEAAVAEMHKAIGNDEDDDRWQLLDGACPTFASLGDYIGMRYHDRSTKLSMDRPYWKSLVAVLLARLKAAANRFTFEDFNRLARELIPTDESGRVTFDFDELRTAPFERVVIEDANPTRAHPQTMRVVLIDEPKRKPKRKPKRGRGRR